MKLDRPLRTRLTRAGQEVLADHLEALDETQRRALLKDLESIDLDAVVAMASGQGVAEPGGGAIEPLPYVPADQCGPDTPAAARGREELAAGRVAFALLAGGQASRLRWDGPKGTFPIGPASERTLFQVLVEHILRAGKDYGRTPPLAVTTSATTDAAIRTFFERNDCFGLDRKQLAFARQASLPALDDGGRVVLAAPDRIFTSPDGHGGAVLALETHGVLAAWEAAGVTTVCTFQVDNPLLRVVDADFIGRHTESGHDIATKVILKREPGQKVGVVVAHEGRPAIVEYSEITDEQAAARDPDGQLTFRLGSIAVHLFRLDFLRGELARELPLHTARKELPCVEADGTPVRRKGIKYERFIFDLFPRAGGITVVEVEPERQYGAVKNAEGKESAQTARAALDAEYRRWYAAAGKTPPDTEGAQLELSPLDVLGPEDL